MTSPISVRRISFDESLRALPARFAGDGDLVMSHVLAALSGLFPDGEDYFVRSVRRVRDHVEEPVLRRQVAGFIGQEAVHGREHRALNGRLAELGYPTRSIERRVRAVLGFRDRHLSAHANLAATAALEHYTATLAETLLSDPEARRLVGSHAVLDVLLWHALEESEHKAVAFDVYRAVGGSERTRRLVMHLTTVTFLLGLTIDVARSLWGARATYERGELIDSLRRLRGNPFASRAVRGRLRDYVRPDFHPDDHDATELLDAWRDRLFGADGTLNDRLVA